MNATKHRTALDLYGRAVANEAELKALIAARPHGRHFGLWLDMLPLATELVAATREAVELAGTEVAAGTDPDGGPTRGHGMPLAGETSLAASAPSARTWESDLREDR